MPDTSNTTVAKASLHQDPGLGPGLKPSPGEASAPASPADAAASPDGRSTSFVAVQGGADSTSAATMLVAAYALMWLLVFAFVWLSFRRLGQLELRLRDLQSALDGRRPASEGGKQP